MPILQKYQKIIKSFGVLLFILVFYASFNTVFGNEAHSIPAVGEKLMTFTDVLTRLMLIACFAVGVGFIFVAILQYQTHRRNPKLVPLDKPIWYFVLGLLLIAIIFLEEIFGGGTGSILHLKKEEKKEATQHHEYNIDAPIDYTPKK